MMNNTSSIDNLNSTNPISFFKIIYKNLVLIILITVFCGLCGVLYSVAKVKPVYTASRSVMLKTSVKIDDFSSTVQGSVTLAKMYLPEVERAIKTPKVIEKANEKYGVEGDKISASAISISYGTDSLIFRVGYTDSNEQAAKAKLVAIIDAASETLPTFIEADGVSLEDVQNEPDVSSRSDFNKYIILGVLAGLIISLVVVFLRHTFDNTIKDKGEYEHITGVSVVAVIDKVEDKNK